jgi:CheY-like chemotaxis protein
MAGSSSHRCTVLVVDDDPEVRELLRVALGSEGYQVATVPNGREALHYLRSSPDACIILLDLMLPVMDGAHFRTAQLHDRSLAWIPLVVMSATFETRHLSSGQMTTRSDAMSSRPRLVLIVEDDPETRRFYTHILERDGLSVDQAHNGHQALEKAFKSTPDLILLDIALPGMDGIELCRRLRADARTVSTPVLAVTGYGDRHYPDRARLAGADHVLIKPCEAAVLVSETRRLLAQTRRLAG